MALLRLFQISFLLILYFGISDRVQAEVSRYGMWNTFLRMENTLEVNNQQNSNAIFQVKVFDSAGKKLSETQLMVPGNEQRSVALAGVGANMNGLLEVQGTAPVVARLVITQHGMPNLGTIELLRESLSGESYLLSNSYSPDSTQVKSPSKVDNWLALANLSTTKYQQFIVRQYFLDGTKYQESKAKIPPLSRRDFLTNISSIQNKAGLISVQASDLSIAYTAQLTRYGLASSSASATTSEDLRFIHLQAGRYSLPSETWIQTSNGANAETWLELANVTNSRIGIKLQPFENSKGELSSLTKTIYLPALSTRHIKLTELLSPGASGAIRLVSPGSGQIIAQTLSYFRAKDATTLALISTNPTLADYPRVAGSFFPFLSTSNWLRLFNTGNTANDYRIMLTGRGGSTEKKIRLSAKRGADIYLNDKTIWSAPYQDYANLSVIGKKGIAQFVKLNLWGPLSGPISTFELPPAVTPDLIYHPPPLTTWQIQYSGELDTSLNVNMYDIDLYDSPEAAFNSLKSRSRKIICYFSAGSWENWRADRLQFPTTLLGHIMHGWPDERWLDIRHIDKLSPLITSRLAFAAHRGCDGVDPDNINAYLNDTGFPLSGNDQLRFNLWLAEKAHQFGLSIGLKNDLEQIPQLVNSYDWALNEQCFQYDECDAYSQFINLNKAVFGIEYSSNLQIFCPIANQHYWSWIKKNRELDAYRESCLP